MRTRSFDDLVGAGEDRWRDREAERLGGVEIDDQLEPRWLLYRQIGGHGALEDLSGVGAEQAIHAREARPVADQAAGHDALAPLVHGGKDRKSTRLNSITCQSR